MKNPLPFPVFLKKLRFLRQIFQTFCKNTLKTWKNCHFRLEKSTFVSCFFGKLAQKGQILKTFCYYNAQNLEKFEKNQLPFPVFGKIRVFKANFSNFLLKYLKNLKNLLTSGGNRTTSGWNSKEIGHFWENFRKIGQKRSTFCQNNEKFSLLTKVY